MAKLGIVEILIIGLLAFAVYNIYIDKPQTTQPTDNLVPSDLITTITLNTRDALATSPTNVDTNYYVFKSTDEFYKEGTTGSDGSDSFDVQYGGNYKMIVFNDSGGDGFLPVYTDFIADSTEGSVKTINAELFRQSGLSISDVRDPIDLNQNISYTAGSTESWNLVYKANVSNRAVLNPILIIDGNKSGIDSDGIMVSSSGWDEIDCPNRLAQTAGRKLWCFEYDGTVTSADGLQSVDGSVKWHDSTVPGACGSGGNVTIDFSMADSQMYRESNYVSEGYGAFKVGAEDAVDADVGQGDSATDHLGCSG